MVGISNRQARCSRTWSSLLLRRNPKQCANCSSPPQEKFALRELKVKRMKTSQMTLVSFMDSTRATKSLIDGFDEDYDTIVEEFRSNHPELRLEEFLKYWDSSYLDCIFANRFDPRELCEALEEINRFLVKKLLDPTTIQTGRVVCIYMILCIAAKQPNVFRRKIRLTCEDAVTVSRVIEEQTGLAHRDDLNYAWKRLKSLDAILFVEDKITYGPSLLTNRAGGRKVMTEDMRKLASINSQPEGDTIDNARAFYQNKIDPLLQEIQGVARPYDEIKASLELDSVTLDGGNVNYATLTASMSDLISRARNSSQNASATQRE